MLIRFQPKFILFAWVVLGLLLALNRPLLCAQNGTGTVEGVVRDTAKQPLANVKVSLDDQVEGRTQATLTDAAGHFRFAGIGASTYILHVRKPGYRDAAEEQFAIAVGETKSLNLQMAAEKEAASGNTTAQAMEYSDEPQFTVAGVTDPSNVGGHGSNVTLPTKEALARDTASLGLAASGTNRSTPSSQPAGELPKVAASDFAGNLRAGRELLQAGRAKESLTYLEQAARLQPADYDAAYSLALAYRKSGDLKR